MGSAKRLMSALVLSAAGAALIPANNAAAALNGALYAVVSPTYTGTNGSTSYLRLFNANQSAAATFTVVVVGTCTGNTYGTANISIPSDASPQFPLSTILTLAGAGALSGCDTQSGDGYALYIQSSEVTAGYEHVTFNPTTSLFEDVSDCKYLLNEAFTAAGHNALIMTNVHTTLLGPYPSQISIHNYWNSAITYKVTVYDAGTADTTTGAIRSGSGQLVGSNTYAVNANSSLSLPMSQLQADIGWTPSGAQYHANVVASDSSGGPPEDVLDQAIVNSQLGGFIDMSIACAVNAPQATGSGGGMAPPPLY